MAVMTLDQWLTYIATVLILMSTPGPSHLLMLSTSMSNGFRRASATALGDLTANALQMLAAGLGLAAVLVASEKAFAIVKWAGVLYLVWLGIRQIGRSFASRREEAPKAAASVRQLWFQGFVTSAANPKAVVFFAALFPQFIDYQAPLAAQMLILGVSYLVIDATFLSAYGAGAGWIARRMRRRVRAWLDRLAGACLIGAALLLGLKSVQKTS